MKDFEMTEEQLREIMNACKPTPVMFLSGGKPMFNSLQENANYAWEKLGKELGFDHMTVKPSGKGNRFFSAEPIGEKEMSEIIEINEDNCVLDEQELYIIDNCLDKLRADFLQSSTYQVNKIFLKINKLNDMAKERER